MNQWVSFAVPTLIALSVLAMTYLRDRRSATKDEYQELRAKWQECERKHAIQETKIEAMKSTLQALETEKTALLAAFVRSVSGKD